MRRYSRLTIFWIFLIYLYASATIINIPDDYDTIQEGIDASTDDDTVLVQPGTYVENVNFNGHNIVLGSLFLTTGDTTYIGHTIIDGDSSETVVIFENGEDSLAVITGFTIQNGYSFNGGGIYCGDYSNPSINYNVIYGNSATSGGGIYCIQSNPLVYNNMISGNRAFQGGGIHCGNSNLTIDNNRISGNSTSAEGGGIWCDNSNPIISNNTIVENSACCGGGIFCWNNSDPAIRNNIIEGNSVSYYGGGITFHNSISLISNNTITGNSADRGGGIFSYTSCDLIIINTIFWADSASSLSNEIHIPNSSTRITYSNIPGGWEGQGNIDIDPLFRDPENGDFHLMSTACGDPNDSPCIDAGSPAIIDSLLDCSWGLGTILSDMGAYGAGDSATVGIIDQQPWVPDRFALLQNYPNPFNARTIIRYDLPSESDVTIEIYDILGRKIETILHHKQPAGHHQAVWNADSRSSGIYFYRIQAGEYAETRKMVLLK